MHGPCYEGRRVTASLGLRRLIATTIRLHHSRSSRVRFDRRQVQAQRSQVLDERVAVDDSRRRVRLAVILQFAVLDPRAPFVE